MHQHNVLHPTAEGTLRSDLDWVNQTKVRYNLVFNHFLDLIDWKSVCIINVSAGTKWLLNPPIFLRLQLHDWGHGRNSASKKKEVHQYSENWISSMHVKTQTAFEVLLTTATHLHRLHGVISIIMNRVPLALWVRVSKTSYVDHITIVESNEHSEDTRGRMHWLLEQTKLNDSPLQ